MIFRFSRLFYKVLWVLLSMLTISACSHSTSTIKSIANDHIIESISIKHEKYTLENGLTVIIHQDDSDPLVHVNLTYHVGSAREEYGKSGFAHFFEHMMFQGSENVEDEEHFQIVTEAGGSMNGSTNSDITNYYQTVPANQLEKILWLEADRMGFLLDAVTQEKFENQRETVKNERGQRVDNRPYGLRGERVGEALYPVGHPYSWSVIGYIEDLNRVDVSDLKAFFQRWYGPNNAVLTIGGDLDKAQTKAWVEKYFGSIPRGPEVEKAKKQPAILNETRFITLEDNVHLPLLQITLPTVYVGHEDEAPLDVLADILGGGRTSLLYKNMVKNGLAIQALASHPCRELACEFNLIALANPQQVANLDQLQTIVEQSLAEFETRGVEDDDLQRTKSAIETGAIFGLQSVEGKVRRLASSEVFYGEPDRIEFDLKRYNAVTKADVMRVYEKYIKDKASVTLSIVPKGQTQLQANAPNFELPTRVIEDDAEPVELTVVEIKDDFDRSIAPTPGVNPNVKLPSFWRTELANGIQVLGVESNETPTVTLYLALEGGVLLDPLDKIGLASITAQMMNESTSLSSNESLSNKLALLGSQISFSTSGRYTNVYVSSLVKNLDATMDILHEKLFQPGFVQADFERVKQTNLQAMQQGLKNPSVLANRARDLILYSEKTRVGLPDEGTLESVNRITLEDVSAFYDANYSPKVAQIVTVGAISQAQILTKLSKLSKWQGEQVNIPSFKDLANKPKRAIYLVDKPDAVQSVVSLVKPAMTFDATKEYFLSSLMNFPLGGMFNSRINLNLREDKGFTYGARSGFAGGKDLGIFSAGADVNAEHTVASIQELIKELKLYAEDGMNQQELTMMKRSITQRDALRYETPNNKAGFLIQMLSYGLESDYRDKQSEIISNVDIETLNKLANKWLDPDSMDIIVVGQAQTLRDELKVFERKIIEIDVPQ